MSSNIDQFDRRIKDRIASIDRRVASRTGEIARFAHRTAVNVSPVDSGDYRDDWNLSSGSPDGTDNPISGAAASIAREASDLGEVQPYEPIYLANSNPAARPIEHGWSDQAPMGVLAIVLARTREFVRRGS